MKYYTIIDHDLNFIENTSSIFKRANQRLLLIRKLRSFDISQQLLEMTYRSHRDFEKIPELSFNITAWYGILSVLNKNKHVKITRIAGKVIGKSQKPLPTIFDRAVLRKANAITKDPSHPLHSAFDLLPSGRSIRVPRASCNI